MFVNMEGRAQQGRVAVASPGDSREDWKIIRAISEVCDISTLSYSEENEMKQRCEDLVPSLKSLGVVSPVMTEPKDVNKLMDVMGRGLVKKTPFQPVNYDFHLQGK